MPIALRCLVPTSWRGHRDRPRCGAHVRCAVRRGGRCAPDLVRTAARSIGSSDERHRSDLRLPDSWGLGYVIGQFMSNAHETQHVFGVGGIGGSHAYADTATGTTFALTKNWLTPNFETAEQVSGLVTRAVADS